MVFRSLPAKLSKALYLFLYVCRYIFFKLEFAVTNELFNKKFLKNLNFIQFELNKSLFIAFFFFFKGYFHLVLGHILYF